MRIKLEVTPYQGEPYQVETNLWVIALWERRTKRKMSDLANAQGAEDLAILAYFASRESGIVVPATVDDYMKSIAEIGIAEDTPPPNPTVAAPSADS
jgi:hypothetical protein